MKILFAPTEQFIKRDTTRILANTSAGNSIQISVPNSNGFATNDYVVVGFEGSEGAEMAKITGTTATSITVDTLVIAHYTDQPIIQYRYNKRKFYGSLTLGGVYSELVSSGSPVQIQVGDPQGAYLEYVGAEGYIYFKSTYFNSTTSDETAIADATSVLADESIRYCSIYAIKKQAGLTNNPFITDGVIETYRRRAENEVDSYIGSKYTLPLTSSSGVVEVPFIIENCCTLLAAGYMDYQEFGKDGEGVKWLGEARSILKNLQAQGGIQLMGSDRVEMTHSDQSSSIQSFPDTVDNVNSPKKWFTMNQKF